MKTSILSTLAISFVLTAPVFAQPAESQPVTRADLGWAYFRLEEALGKADPSVEVRTEANKMFDEATLAFFGGKMAEAVATVNRATAEVLDKDMPPGGELLRIDAVPPLYVRGEHDTQRFTLASMNPAESTNVGGKLVLETMDGDEVRTWPMELVQSETDASTSIQFEPDDLESGQYWLVFRTEDDLPLASTRWILTDQSLDAVREQNAGRIDALTGEMAGMKQAIATLRAQNALLTNTPSQENTAQFVLDLHALAESIADDIEAVEAGENPFKGRTGDYWRVLNIGDKDVPFRVYMPASAAEESAVPVVVAFHGAGGDENMFMSAYGAGIIKRLADEHGFLLASPLTYEFGGSDGPERFDQLVDALALTYPIDRHRIYVIGHSMGGGAITNLAKARPEAITAAVALAGFRGYEGAESVPPTYVIAAEHDPLVPPARIEPLAKQAEEAGLPVEYELLKGYGHTLVVGDVLPKAVEWLLQHGERAVVPQ